MSTAQATYNARSPQSAGSGLSSVALSATPAPPGPAIRVTPAERPRAVAKAVAASRPARMDAPARAANTAGTSAP
ncbi:hypothetical protein, partial [Streptosporangium nondiastaticum]|uniref:hypothetical protein n=1 Tax=Streptosporangium nondiastaticum TaxID=35764 RepID=UPI001CB94580